MTRQENLIKASHLIDMADIIREGNPTLREVAADVALPLHDDDIILGEKMLAFLRHSQDPVMAEKMGLRGGVGLAAPQLDVSKKIIACLVPKEFETEDEAEKANEAYSLATIMYNAKIVSHSVQDAALADGEGCLSVDREVQGYVVRHARVTVDYFDKNGDKQRLKLKGYDAMVVQHEIDHTNGVMFYDRIDEKNPFGVRDGMLIIE
ncbi:peptide deformylase [Lactococcus hodotermopsidis]|uniref:Peptide deformylase n=1 Tax=Pseudolactococcus hodotermopsidis TaxID=2709157 RepID=A0A6A0BC74_9LACT|nr:peptide deformylase [Lactococcus hodotermopsidis]GFH42014.1 peptide deformylase [Lactococcus hodotermopsidis]